MKSQIQISESPPPPALSPVAMGMRTGPLGRAVRLLGAVVLILGVNSLISIGPTHFRQASALRSPGVWILTVVVAILVTDLIVRFLPVSRRARGLILAALGGAIVAAGGISLASSGSVWGAPLSDLIWWIDVADLSYSAGSLLLAVPLGTPGCEKLAWVELKVLLFGGQRPRARWCIGGLHIVDNWELGRKVRHTARIGGA